MKRGRESSGLGETWGPKGTSTISALRWVRSRSRRGGKVDEIDCDPLRNDPFDGSKGRTFPLASRSFIGFSSCRNSATSSFLINNSVTGIS